MQQGFDAVRQQYQAAVQALNLRDWVGACREASAILPVLPKHGGVHFIVGVASLELQQIQTAFRHLALAARLSPDRADYLAQWARVLSACNLPREAVEQSERAMLLGAQDPVTFNTLAVVFTRANAHQRAVEAFRHAVALAPKEPSFRYNLATSLVAVGELTAAISQCEACIDLEPHFWRAHLTLAQLRRHSDNNHHLERLASLLESKPITVEAQLYLHLAMEKECDDLGRYLEAFDHLVQGKAAVRATMAYDSSRDKALFESIMQADTSLRRDTQGDLSEEPIFILGMPRSGTTLVERIISSHSQVYAAGELHHFPVSLDKEVGLRGGLIWDGKALQRLGQVDWRTLGKTYVDSTRPLAGHTRRFIDKLPHNFLYAGFIARALPNARIICLRRDATDTCIANFRQLFLQTSRIYDYSFDLLDVGRYYLLFDQLMAYWQANYPGRILEVAYEDIVQQQEVKSRELIEFCGLPWENACLQFERNASPVSTASAVQVRSGIYRTSLQRWRRYGERVAPLRALLREGGVAVPD